MLHQSEVLKNDWINVLIKSRYQKKVPEICTFCKLDTAFTFLHFNVDFGFKLVSKTPSTAVMVPTGSGDRLPVLRVFVVGVTGALVL